MTASGVKPIERLVLDTSAYSHLRVGHAHVLDIVANAAAVFVPVIVIGELEAAFELGSRSNVNRAALAEFLAEPFVSQLEVNHAVARRYGEVFAGLRRAGTPIPVNDIWIAALTTTHGGHLLTFDPDFSGVDSLVSTILSPI